MDDITKKKLIDFLNKHEALEMYEHNLMKQYGSAYTLEESYEYLDPKLAISGAFSFGANGMKGTFDFWVDLKNKWKEELYGKAE